MDFVIFIVSVLNKVIPEMGIEFVFLFHLLTALSHDMMQDDQVDL